MHTLNATKYFYVDRGDCFPLDNKFVTDDITFPGAVFADRNPVLIVLLYLPFVVVIASPLKGRHFSSGPQKSALSKVT
jgi:hypothetical protein